MTGVLLAAMCVPPALSAEDARPRPFAVTFSTAGPDGEAVDASMLDGFVESLAARPGFAAQATARTGLLWFNPPVVKNNERLSMVAVAVGDHRDLLALMWDDKGTTIVAAARRPCRIGAKGRRDWYGPGPYQLPENAVKELAADVGHTWKPGLARDESRRVQVNVKSWLVSASDLTAGMDALVKEKKGAEAERPVAASTPAIDGVKALTFAALSESNLQASSEPAPITLDIELAQATDHYAFRCTLKRDGKTSTYQRRFVPRSDLYDHLVTTTRKMLVWSEGVRDAAKLGAGDIEPLAATKGIVAVNVGEHLLGIDPQSGETKWAIEAAPKTAPRYFAWPAGDNQPGVICLFRDAGRIDLNTGKSTSIAAMVPALPAGFDLIGDQYACIRESTAALYKSAKEAWKTTLNEPLVCGPAIHGENLIVANDAGELIALKPDGKELWRQPTQLRLRGPIALLDGKLLVGSLEGALLAVSPTDGKTLWKHAARDVLLQRPVLVDGLLLIADKGDTLWLLDPKTGEARANFLAPTWIRSVRAIEHANKKWIVCVDRQGTVRFLTLPDLKVAREVRLATSPATNSLFSAELPLNWASHDDLEQKAPGLLVGSTDGWLYLLDIP